MLMTLGWAQATDVTLSNKWSFFDPEGNSHLENQTATNFDFYVHTISNNIVAAAAVFISSITTNTPNGGIFVTAQGHGLTTDGTPVYIKNTGVTSYDETWLNLSPVLANIVDANTLYIPELAYAADATNGTIGTSSQAVGGNAVRPRVYQIFNPVDMSAIGAAFSVQFDVQLLGWCQSPGANNAWRLVIGDTVKNAEIIGLVGIGQSDNRTDAFKIRLDNQAFNSPPYNTSNPFEGPMGTGGQSWNVRAMYPMPHGLVNNVNRLQQPGPGGGTHRFFMNLVRVSTNELSVLLKWQIIADVGGDEHAGDGTELYVLHYDETTGTIGDTGFTASPTDAWATAGTNGSLNQINFFGMKFEVDSPFGQSAGNPSGNENGGVKVTNIRVGTENYFKPYTKIVSLTRDSVSGNVSLSWDSFQDSNAAGSKYNISAANNADFSDGTVIESSISANASGVTTSLELSTTAPARFYRIDLSPRPFGN